MRSENDRLTSALHQIEQQFAAVTALADSLQASLDRATDSELLIGRLMHAIEARERTTVENADQPKSLSKGSKEGT